MVYKLKNPRRLKYKHLIGTRHYHKLPLFITDDYYGECATLLPRTIKSWKKTRKTQYKIINNEI